MLYDTGTSSGAHPDALQFDGGVVGNLLEQFNTVYQPVGGGEVAGMEGSR